jgi:hypothetical protein
MSAAGQSNTCCHCCCVVLLPQTKASSARAELGKRLQVSSSLVL